MNEIELEYKKNNESNENDFKVRPYQDQLLEIALKENVIIYLPTGSGKTYIALMAIRHMSYPLTRPLKEGGKRTVFICNTVALSKQQADVISKYTNLKTSVYTGDMNVDNWKYEKWFMEFDMNQVIVATVQIILDVIRHGYLKISNFNLIIFDECHHAKGEHPMFQLMSFFQNYPESEHPRVIGLTGLLINPTKKNAIVDSLNSLERTFRAKIITVKNFNELQNVLVFSTKPKEVFMEYNDNSFPLHVSVLVKKIITDLILMIPKWKIDATHVKLSKNLCESRVPNPIKKIENLLKDFLYQLDDLGVYGGSISILSVIVELELKKRLSETNNFRNLIRICIQHCIEVHHLLEKTMNDFDDDEENEEIHVKITSYSSLKVQTLLQFLKNTCIGKNSNDIKCLVFVQRRYTAKCLYHIIKNWSESIKTIPIKANFMVGQHESLPESTENILETKWAKNTLLSFKRNESNLIVCSSVLEEGIDLQSCNVVVMFDEIQTFRSYIQTKGRARQNESVYLVLLPSSEKGRILAKIREYGEIDSTLKDYLIGKAIDRSPPLKEEIDEKFAFKVEPFFTPIGARLDITSSIQLLNRYCASLPSDSFTSLVIDWKKEEENGYIRVTLLLPLQSSLKEEVSSGPVNCVKIGKQLAAFEACKKLYELGELNENLLPVTKTKRTLSVNPLYFKQWKEFSGDDPKIAGSKKNKRIYDIEFPKQLISATPESKKECYMYTINLKPLFTVSDQNEHIIDLFLKPSCFAILTSNLLPEIAEMPMFMNYGCVQVNISYNPIRIYIENEKDIEYLRNFHVTLFRYILNLWKNSFTYDRNNNENSYFIVPTSEDGKEINWDLVKKHQKTINIELEIDQSKRSKLEFNINDYEQSLVLPWYNPDTSIRYVVKKIRNDLTPLSSFPNTEYKNYVDYFYKKYSIKIVNTKTFLLEVKPITSRLNFLTFTDGSKKKRNVDDIFLIPELCHNFKFPGDMYLKAIFLPSILHRLHYILHAENLRNEINSYLNLNFPNYKPAPIAVDNYLKRITNEEHKQKSSTKNEINLSKVNDKPKTNKTVKSITETSQCDWKEHEEPFDYSKYLQNLYIIEIDYYYYFVTRKLSELSISTQNERQLFDFDETPTSNNLAICDLSVDDIIKINILNISTISKSAEQSEFLAAITSSAASDVFDMERLELLGDSFLKFGISLYLLNNHPTWNEGHLTGVKGKFVSNQNLLYCAIKKKLPGLLNASLFLPNDNWIPPSISVPLNVIEFLKQENVSSRILWQLNLSEDEILKGECFEKTFLNLKQNFSGENNDDCSSKILIKKQEISDKTCADSMEAILGVCVKNYGIQKTLSVLQYLGICEENKNLTNLLSLDFGNPRLKPNTTDSEIDSFLINYELIEKKLGYKFKDRAYLLQALTHPSYPKNRLTDCYQKLEFIGDAVLDFLISSYIFEHCVQMDPGEITDLRSALVNNVSLACISVRNSFHIFMLIQSASLSSAIEKFVTFQQKQNYKLTDQVRILIQEDKDLIKSTSTSSETKFRKTELLEAMADYIDVPKVLGDVFESLIGAIFLDSKNDLKLTWKVIYNLLGNEINLFMSNVPKQPVRQLYEFSGANPKFSSPEYLDDVVMITCKFTCRDKIFEVNGFGKNKEQAKISAAKLALQNLFQS